MKSSPLVIASTFTATPIKQDLVDGFLQHHPDDQRDLAFIQYDHTLQFLRNQKSVVFSEKIPGCVLLLRIEDWFRHYKSPDGNASKDKLNEFMKQYFERISRIWMEHILFACQQCFPITVLLVKSIGSTTNRLDTGELFESYNRQVKEKLLTCDTLSVIEPNQLSDVTLYDDATDEIGQMPFTEDGYSILSKIVFECFVAQSTSSVDKTTHTTSSPIPTYDDLGLTVSVEPCPADSSTRIERMLRSYTVFSTSGVSAKDNSINDIWRHFQSGLYFVHVSDDYSNYGPSGLIIAKQSHEVLSIKHFCLSCSVLGKKVESLALKRLLMLLSFATEPTQHTIYTISISFCDSGRNDLAGDFLRMLLGPFFVADEKHYLVPIDVLKQALVNYDSMAY